MRRGPLGDWPLMTASLLLDTVCCHFRREGKGGGELRGGGVYERAEDEMI